MNEKLRAYIENVFADAPQTVRATELKEEMYQNLCDKYNDLIAEGKTDEAAYNIAVASIGDVRMLLSDMNRGQAPSAQAEAAGKRSALLISVAVALYIVAVVPVILLGDEIGVVLMFVLAAIATGLLIYNGATRKSYVKSDETVVEDFKAWKQQKSDKSNLKRAITGAMWLLICCTYLVLSFLTGAWHITWMVYLVGAALSLIISGIFDLQ